MRPMQIIVKIFGISFESKKDAKLISILILEKEHNFGCIARNKYL